MRAIGLWLLAAGCWLLGLAPVGARAEEGALVIHLAYVQGYSNTGPSNAYGLVHLWPSEAVAALTVHALPRQENGDTYAWWVVNTVTGDAMRLGGFNTTDAGDGSQDTVFTSTLPRGANAVVVTVQHPGAPISQPGAQRAIAGFFPAIAAPPLVPTAIPTAAPTAVPTAASTPTAGTASAHAGTRTPSTGAHGHPATIPTRRTHGSVHRPVRRPVVLPQTGGGRQASLRLKSHGRPRRLKSLPAGGVRGISGGPQTPQACAILAGDTSVSVVCPPQRGPRSGAYLLVTGIVRSK